MTTMFRGTLGPEYDTTSFTLPSGEVVTVMYVNIHLCDNSIFNLTVYGPGRQKMAKEAIETQNVVEVVVDIESKPVTYTNQKGEKCITQGLSANLRSFVFTHQYVKQS